MTHAPEVRRDFHILSLDGGGTRGIYGAQILTRVEETLGAEVRDCFDLITGASTGSIIAGAAAAGIPMKEVVGLFENDSLRIFKKTPFLTKPESTEGGRRVSVLKRQEGAPVLLG